jgi:hypothetical protein
MPSHRLARLACAAAIFAASLVPAAATTLLPDFSAATFVPGAAITNRFFPLVPGLSQTYASRTATDQGITEELSIHATQGAGPQILGVNTTTVLDRAFTNGLLMEETLDYYAQDSDGSVWYMGEDVTNYVYDDAGNLIETNSASAWRAGVSGGLPGFIMPAEPSPGMAYFQEFAAENQALDEALIYALDQTVTVGSKTYSGVLVTFESSSLDPDLRELKYYAPGVGLIRVEEGVDENFANPQVIANLVGPAPVPVPAAAFLLAGALAAFGLVRRRRRPAYAGRWHQHQ